MEISLPGHLASFVEEQVAERGAATADAFVQDLVRKEADRVRLRRALLQGVASPPGPDAEDEYFDRLRESQRTVSRA